MEAGMWKFNIEQDSFETPREIVANQCKELSKLTKGKVIARITEYEGEYKSYSNMSNLKLMSETVNMMIGKNFDVQEALGEESEDEQIVYEFYLTANNTPKYKYRIFFLYHGIMFYPVGISLEKGIAKELGLETEFLLNTQEDFKECLAQILGSNKVALIIQNLYKMSSSIEF